MLRRIASIAAPADSGVSACCEGSASTSRSRSGSWARLPRAASERETLDYLLDRALRSPGNRPGPVVAVSGIAALLGFVLLLFQK